MTEEELIKWERGLIFLDGKFEKVDSWGGAFYALDAEDDILYTIDYDRVMEPMLSFEDILKLAEIIKEKREGQ